MSYQIRTMWTSSTARVDTPVGIYSDLRSRSEHLNRCPDRDWFRFTLNRDARVGIVWRSEEPVPGWLTSWTKGGTVIIDDRDP